MSDAPAPAAVALPEIEIGEASGPVQIDDARRLIGEYASQLGVDLAFQDFGAELAELPGQYAAPGGVLLLARADGALAGCGAFRPLPDVDYPNACEMKRLYVRRPFRRYGLGRLLALRLMDRALEAGYSTMLLDTLDDMEAARHLYVALGFEEIPPYYYNPVPGAHYLKVELARAGVL